MHSLAPRSYNTTRVTLIHAHSCGDKDRGREGRQKKGDKEEFSDIEAKENQPLAKVGRLCLPKVHLGSIRFPTANSALDLEQRTYSYIYVQCEYCVRTLHYARMPRSIVYRSIYPSILPSIPLAAQVFSARQERTYSKISRNFKRTRPDPSTGGKDGRNRKKTIVICSNSRFTTYVCCVRGRSTFSNVPTLKTKL